MAKVKNTFASDKINVLNTNEEIIVELVKAIFLGVLQGFSEFLPISSSGHLVIAEHLLNFNEGGLAFEVFVHFGTLLSVLVAFRKDIVEMVKAIPEMFRLNSQHISDHRRYYALFNIYIIIGTIPAAFFGILFKDKIERLFDSYVLALLMLFVTGLIMWSSRYTQERRDKINGLQALIIGIAQAFAIIPGISRSGSTIVTGLWMGIPRGMVAKFSFILSLPVIFGASIIKLKDLFDYPIPRSEILNIAIASLFAALSGYLAIIWLLDIIKKQKLEWFGVYCILVSIFGLILI